MSDNPNGYFIPARPQISIEETPSGMIKIEIWAMDAGNGQEHHEFELSVRDAEDFADSIQYVVKNAVNNKAVM